MTMMLVLMHSGGSDVAQTGAGHAPYYVAGTILLLLIAAMVSLLMFGKGREHS